MPADPGYCTWKFEGGIWYAVDSCNDDCRCHDAVPVDTSNLSSGFKNDKGTVLSGVAQDTKNGRTVVTFTDAAFRTEAERKLGRTITTADEGGVRIPCIPAKAAATPAGS